MIKKLLSFLIVFTLCGCGITPPPSPVLNKKKNFSRVYYICEMKDWRPWGSSGIYFARTDESYPTCGASIASTPPSFQEYLKNKDYWHNWHGFDVKTKILGTVSPNTSYYIKDYVVGALNNTTTYIVIDSGPFKGLTVRDFGDL